ncbi:MAG: HAMP domain-containing protein, partial [Anaerolineae bacterium]|nr:HAMP domain-containing protein [Anaerolineae bacterium]
MLNPPSTLADNSKFKTQNSPLFFTRYPLLLFVAGVVVALIAALIVIVLALNPPGSDIGQLVVFLLSSSGATLLAAYAVYRRGLARWFRSLRWALLVTILLTVALVFLNVWITAQLMFLNDHDLWLTTALLVFAGLTAIAFGLFIADTITERIRLLGCAAERLAGGNLETRVTVQGNDELAELARTFNMMAHSLQEVDAQKRALEQTRRNLIAWVSHDLRTPLASMRVMVEAMADGVVTDPADVARYLDNTQAEIEHLSRLID